MTNEEDRPMNLTHSLLSTRGAMFAVFTAALLAGCSSVKLDDVPVETRTPTAAGAGAGAGTSGAGQSRVEPVDLTKGAGNAAGSGRVIYFDFDSYVVKDEYRGVIDSYAKALAADRKKHLSVEGHTDERGGREYNLALGQKRAEAVAKSLALLGAGDAQVEAVSFGKERPAVQGSDEAAWAKNRRAELNYR
jgi:peptidoglycan-associated lipoprotein